MWALLLLGAAIGARRRRRREVDGSRDDREVV
jgi:hypothetical protein